VAVDIVIDNYNYGRFLAEAIDSACNQTHPKVNVIAVDDGSTDDSRAVLEAARERITVVLKDNGGQASAINEGMTHCKGEVVIFLDADDLLRPDAAARAAATFAADETVAKVQFRMDVVDATGHPTGATKPASHLPAPSGDMRRAELDSPFDMPWRATSGNAFRAETLRRILPMPEDDFSECADWYLVHLTALLGSVVSIDEVGAAYRVHGGNSYEPEVPEFDLDRIRRTIGFADSTKRQLARLADEIGLQRPARILSVWDLANRMISLRCDPASHPLAADRRSGLLADSIRAVRRRDGIALPMKLMFVAWFAVMTVAPRRFVPRLGELFLYSERRPGFSRLLGLLHRNGEGGR
jgi:glycosyltransferase involved in cell wall biosynthesis